MLAHLHPSLYRSTVWLVLRLQFTTLTRLSVLRWSRPRTTMTESPFALSGRYHSRGDVCRHLERSYPLIIAHTGSCARPKPSCCLQSSLFQQVFAGCCQPLLGDGPSRHYLCNPCVGAWTPTPRCPPGALARFFPEGNGLTSDVTGSAHRKYSLQCNFYRGLFLGAAVIPLCSGSHAR